MRYSRSNLNLYSFTRIETRELTKKKKSKNESRLHKKRNTINELMHSFQKKPQSSKKIKSYFVRMKDCSKKTFDHVLRLGSKAWEKIRNYGSGTRKNDIYVTSLREKKIKFNFSLKQKLKVEEIESDDEVEKDYMDSSTNASYCRAF